MRTLAACILTFLLTCAAGTASGFAAGTGPGPEDARTDGTEVPLIPRLPVFLGSSGSLTADPSGYATLFSNPAGFSGRKGSVTLLSTAMWFDLQPETAIPEILGEFSRDGISPRSFFAAVQPEIAQSGFGYGAETGIGIVGRGLGFAVTGVTQGSFRGSSPESLVGGAQAEIAITGGIAFPFHLLGIDFSVGGDVRPLARIHAPLDSAHAASVLSALQQGNLSLAIFNGVPTLNGYGLGLDAGFTASTGGFSFGASLRDIGGTRLNYSLHNFETVMSYLGQGGLPPTGASLGGDLLSHDYSVPMRLNLGLVFHPDFGATARFFDPRFSIELPDAVPVFAGQRNVLPSLRAALSMRLFSFLDLFGSVAVDYVAAGVDLKLLFLDLSVAGGMRTVATAVDAPSSGISAEFAIRF